MLQKQRNHIHFIGICGVAMAPIAKMFKDLGWRVTGSDKGFFPPVSEYLKANKIDFLPGWHAERMDKKCHCEETKSNWGDEAIPRRSPRSLRSLAMTEWACKPDLVVVGNFIGPNNPEFVYVKEQGIPYTSYPEIVAEYIIKKKSIVVAGTYGKTTISACLAWILEQAGLNPSYMSGGLLLNFPDGARTTDSQWSVVEGDEYSTSRWDPRPKFAHYQPSYLVVTSTQWDHTDVYKTEGEYLEVFKQLVSSVPKDGLIVYNEKEVDPEVIQKAGCRVVPYAAGDMTTALIGSHNLQNLSAAATLAREIGISDGVIKKSISSFKGARRRLEIRTDINGVKVIDDLAHSPPKARASIAAVRETYPHARIRVIFEPNIGSRTKAALPLFHGAFDDADEVYIPRLSAAKKNETDSEWVSGEELVNYIKSEIRNPKSETSLEIRNSKFEIIYIENDEELVKRLVAGTKPSDVIVFMGSHGFRGMIEEIISLLPRFRQ